MSQIQKVLVLGGTGFIGREVCRRAVQLGLNVTSLSRRGRISGAYLSSDDVRKWESKVNWRIGSALDQGVMKHLVATHDAIIHSIGILFESSLNQLVSGASTDAAGTTYEQANTATALVPLRLLADQKPAAGHPPKPFVFISATTAPPFRSSYLTSKYEVEQKMEELNKRQALRSIIFKPGIVYHHSKWSSLPISRLAMWAHATDAALERNLGVSLKIGEPTPLDLLATAILRAISKPTVSGVFTNEDMWALANPANREV